MSEKTEGQILKEKLFYKSENAYNILDKSNVDAAYEYAKP